MRIVVRILHKQDWFSHDVAHLIIKPVVSSKTVQAGLHAKWNVSSDHWLYHMMNVKSKISLPNTICCYMYFDLAQNLSNAILNVAWNNVQESKIYF